MAMLSRFTPKDPIHVTKKTFVQSVATDLIDSRQYEPFPLFHLERLADERIRFSILSVALEDTS